MQSHPSQLPIDAPASPAPKNLKKGAFLLLLAVMAVAAVIAFMLPKKHVEANRLPNSTPPPTSRLQRAQTDAYKKPTP